MKRAIPTIKSLMITVLLGTLYPALLLCAEDPALSSCSIAQLEQDAAQLYADGRPREALTRYEEALRRDPQDIAALNSRGRIFGDLGELGKAVADFTLAIDLFNAGHNPSGVKLAHLYHRRGHTFSTMGRNEEALADVNQALQLDPGYLNALNTKGVILRAMGLPVEAEEAFNQALKIDPWYFEARVNKLAIAMDVTHDYSLAERICDGLRYESAAAESDNMGNKGQAANLSKPMPVVHALATFYRNCAAAMKSLGKTTSEDDYRHMAASAIVDSADELCIRAIAREEIGEKDAALADYRTAMAKEPGLASAYTGAARLLSEQGSYAEALQAYDDLLKTDPHSKAATDGRALTLAKLGRRPDEEMRQASQAATPMPQEEALLAPPPSFAFTFGEEVAHTLNAAFTLMWGREGN